MTDQENLEKYEIMLWQIVRMHANEIKITIEFTPNYGVPFYVCKMTVNTIEYHSSGRNLWKRYREFILLLKSIYNLTISI